MKYDGTVAGSREVRADRGAAELDGTGWNGPVQIEGDAGPSGSLLKVPWTEHKVGRTRDVSTGAHF